MEKSKSLILIFILISISLNIYLGVQCFLFKLELDKTNESIAISQMNQKDLFFAKLLVEKILQGGTEVGFNDRLKLENAVRDLNDPEIFAQWQKFTKSTNNEETQQSIGMLFSLLLKKISY